MPLKAKKIKYVFSFILKQSVEKVHLNDSGRLLHSFGAATAYA